MSIAKQIEELREQKVDTTPPVPPPNENQYIARPTLKLVTTKTPEENKGRANSAAISVAINDLYHDKEAVSPELNMALRLMLSGLGYLDEASEAAENEEIIVSDSAAMKFQALLPELFCCRSIGDGFGEAINSIQNAFDNLNGVPPTKAQIEAIGRLLRRVHDEPFIKFDNVLDEVEKLEKSGLIVEPAEFEHISNLLNV